MLKRLLDMFLFIAASLSVIIILVSPMSLFNGKDAIKFKNRLSTQNIAPQRLFVACWRNIKSSYIDSSMNHQDWQKWKYRYLKHIKTDEDVAVAVNSMLASLNDPNSEFINEKKYKIQESFIRENEDGLKEEITESIIAETEEEPEKKAEKEEIVKPLKTASVVTRNKAQQVSEGKQEEDKTPVPPLATPNTAQIELKTLAGIVEKVVITNTSKDLPFLQRNDVIVSINNHVLKGFEANQAIKLLRNSSNILKLEVSRKGKILTFSVLKKILSVSKITAKNLDDDIVFISVFSLMGDYAPNEFKKIINDYPKAKGYIIDLRGNAGGLFLNPVYIADLFLNNGEMVTINYRGGREIKVYADADVFTRNKPVVVLINNNTASASEILAGILRNNNRAILVGEKSYGKNSIQQIIPMPNHTGINLTMAKYNFSNKNITDKGSLIPDFVIPLEKKDIKKHNDVQLKKAIEIIKKLNET